MNTRATVTAQEPQPYPQPGGDASSTVVDQGAGQAAKPVAELVGELSMSAWALAALGCADETGLLDDLAEPRSPDALASRCGLPTVLTEALLDVLLALGLARRDGAAFVAEPALADMLIGPARALLRADLRSHLLQSAHLIDTIRRGVPSIGWRHTDPHILQAQGTRSSAVVTAWANHVFAELTGLNLDAPGATFLDVGTGVAAIAIAMCQRFPGLRAVGLDPWALALTEARVNIDTAQLADRVTLREGEVEELADESVFDLVHIPVIFLSTEHVQRGLRRVWTALKPGGWLLLQVLGAPGAALTPAVLRLWCVLWGGEASMIPGRVEQMLLEADFQEIRTFSPLPGPPVRYVVARRPPKQDEDEPRQ